MVGFYIYETDTLTLKLNKKNVLVGAKKVIVSIYQKSSKAKIDKDETELGLDIENSKINISLSQEETGQFIVGKAEIQVNIYYEDRERDVSSKSEIQIYDNLYKKVISDG